MKPLLLAVLVTVTSGSQYDHEINFFDEDLPEDWIYTPYFGSETISLEDTTGFEQPSAQSNEYLANAAYSPPVPPAQTVNIQPEHQYNTVNINYTYQESVEMATNSSYLTSNSSGLQYSFQPTVVEPAQTYVAPSNTAQKAPPTGLTSSGLLAVDHPQALSKTLTKQGAASSVQGPPLSNFVPINQVLPATDSATVSGKSLPACHPQPHSSAQNNEYGTTPRLPIRLLIQVLNAVSVLMERESISLASTVVCTVETTFERFQELLWKLFQLDESAFNRTADVPGDVVIDKASVKASLQRIFTQQHIFLSGKKDVVSLLTIMTGQNYSTQTYSDCYKQAAEVLVCHAMVLYGQIPGITLDNTGALTVNGIHFPEPQKLKAFYQELYDKRSGGKTGSAVTSKANTSNQTVNNPNSEFLAGTLSGNVSNSHPATSTNSSVSSTTLLFGNSPQPLQPRPSHVSPANTPSTSSTGLITSNNALPEISPRSSNAFPANTSSISSTGLLFGNDFRPEISPRPSNASPASTSNTSSTRLLFNNRSEPEIPPVTIIPSMPVQSRTPPTNGAFHGPTVAQARPLEAPTQSQVPTILPLQIAHPLHSAPLGISNESNNKKRKLDQTAEQPAAKIQKNTTVLGKHIVTKINMRLFIKLHNYIACYFKIKPMVFNENVGNIAPFVVESLHAMIDAALKNDRRLITANIHGQYRIDKGSLKAAQEYFEKKTIPSAQQPLWLLKAFGVPDPKPKTTGDQLYHLANWYTAVALSLIESLPNVRFEDGGVWVENEPFLLQI